MVTRICVFCASSEQIDRRYLEEAHTLGELLARSGITVVFGGGAIGSMGSLADGAMAAGGDVIGVIPEFMMDLEWGHPDVSRLDIVADMHERKKKMLDGADAVIALPGGTGTFEELFETLTLKRLGIYCQPIILVNTNGFFNHLRDLLDRCIHERFMREKHREMWTIVDKSEAVLDAVKAAAPWSSENRALAALYRDGVCVRGQDTG